MGLFDHFKKPASEGEPKGEPKEESGPEAQNEELPLPVLCYRTAYFVLPQLLFAAPDRLIGYFTRNEYPTGPYLYALATRILKVEGNNEDVHSFQTHVVELIEGVDGYILEYPTPPPFDLEQKGGVLAPFFSVIVQHRDSSKTSYYTLGQNPLNGTTFRTVMPDGGNANMGPGPSPDLESFIEFLRQRLEAWKQV